MRFLSIFLIFLSFISFSDILAAEKHQLSGIKVKELSIEIERAIKKEANNSFYLKGETASHFLNLNLNTDIGNYTYLNQKIKSIVGESRFRYIEYNLELGVKPFNGVDIYIRHLSGHALDQTFSQGDFPEDNSVGIRFILIRN